MYADYVFGRMMKTRILFDKDSVTVGNSKPVPSYQGWAYKYNTYDALVKAAAKELGVSAEKEA